jgi:hypothetical protein
MPNSLTYLLLSFTLIFTGCNNNTCEEDGKPANRQENEYYPNNKIRISRTIKNCRLEGDVIYFYENGKVEHIENYKAGLKSGTWKYYTEDEVEYQAESYRNDTLFKFSISDLADVEFSFDGKRLFLKNGTKQSQLIFDQPPTFYGHDRPFVSIYNNLLLMRGRQDYYAIDRNLKIRLNLRDTLIKYIPSAFEVKTDFSAHRFSFDWHRDVIKDSLKVKVFYGADSSRSSQKTWQQDFVLK